MTTNKVKFIFSRSIKFSFFGWLIRFFTNCKFSHVAIWFIDPYTKQEMIYEASHGEAHYILFDNWAKKNKIMNAIEFEIDNTQNKLMLNRFNEWSESTSYGFLNIIGIALTIIIPFIKKNIFADKDNTLICSELGALVFLFLFDLSYPNDKLELLTPKDTYYLIAGKISSLTNTYEVSNYV